MRAPQVFTCPHGARVIERCEDCDQNPATQFAECLKQQVSSAPECETVELDENGVVVFRDKSGHPVMWMPRSTYEAYLALAGKKSELGA
jgi:hypothetical protein